MPEKNPKMSHIHPDENQLNEFLDGYLDESAMADLEMHLETCPDCTARLGELQTVFFALAELPDVDLDQDFSKAVISELQPVVQFSGLLKWGALAQVAFTFVLLLFSIPALLNSWTPYLDELRINATKLLSENRLVINLNWSEQLAFWQTSWENWLLGWQFSPVFETTQIVVWPLFLTALLLFVIGNGLLLKKVGRDEVQ